MPSGRRRTSAAVLGLLVGFVLTGCSEDTPAGGDRSGDEPSATASTPADAATSPSATAPPATSAPPSDRPTGPDPVCGGLDLDEVRAVLAADMKSYLAEVDYCIYARPRERRPTLIVTAVPTLGDPAEFARETRDTCESDLTDVPDIGDAAWVCYAPLYGPQGYVVEGEAFVQLDLASGDDRADLASLLELVAHVEVPTGLEFAE